MQTQGDFLVPQNSFQPAGPGPVNLIPVVQPAPQLGQPTTVQPPGQQTCALPECPNPCHVEDSGRVHDCCSRTHAAEYERRLAQQQQQQRKCTT